MKRWRIWQISLFVVFCIMINYGGRVLAASYDLPLWLDAYGTVLCAYAGGPVCGAIVGLASNLIYGMMNGISYIYALTSVAIGLIVGFWVRRKKLNTFFDTMTVAAIAAMAAVIISVPLNMIFYDGSTGNLWGNGVIGFFRERNLPLPLCRILGQFYVEFLDKLLTLVLLFITVRLVRLARRGGAPLYQHHAALHGVRHRACHHHHLRGQYQQLQRDLPAYRRRPRQPGLLPGGQDRPAGHLAV